MFFLFPKLKTHSHSQGIIVGCRFLSSQQLINIVDHLDIALEGSENSVSLFYPNHVNPFPLAFRFAGRGSEFITKMKWDSRILGKDILVKLICPVKKNYILSEHQ